jgi:hypothetical protein
LPSDLPPVAVPERVAAMNQPPPSAVDDPRHLRITVARRGAVPGVAPRAARPVGLPPDCCSRPSLQKETRRPPQGSGDDQCPWLCSLAGRQALTKTAIRPIGRTDEASPEGVVSGRP